MITFYIQSSKKCSLCYSEMCCSYSPNKKRHLFLGNFINQPSKCTLPVTITLSSLPVDLEIPH